MRAWISPLFLLALLLSLIMHCAASFGDMAWAMWQNRDIDSSPPVIKAVKRQLKGQSIELTAADQAILAGVVPADQLTLYLAPFHRSASLPQVPATVNADKPQSETSTSEATVSGKAPTALATETATIAPNTAPAVATANSPAEPPVLAVTDKPKISPDEAKPTAEANAATKTNRPVFEGPFPKSVDIIYMIKGLVTADHHWRVHGKQYEIDTQASFAGKAFEMKSEGEIGPHGLKPKRFTEYRDRQSQPKYLVDFDWERKIVRFGEPTTPGEASLEEGAQDLFSAAYQFALQGDKLPSFNMQVVSGRKSYQLAFEIKGEAELTLSQQKVNTLVLVGSHDKSRFEFYLAPDWHNLPVRIRRIDGDNTLDLVAVQVTLDNKMVLQRPERKTRDR